MNPPSRVPLLSNPGIKRGNRLHGRKGTALSGLGAGHGHGGTQRRRLAQAGGEEPCAQFFVRNTFPPAPKKPNIRAAFAAIWTSSTSWLTRHCEFKQDDKLGVFWRCVMATVKSSRGFRVSLPAAAWGMASGSPLRPATVGGC